MQLVMKTDRQIYSSVVLLAILGVALALRLWHLSTWSLWEDEENTIYFAHRISKVWEGYPLFFTALKTLYRMTDVSVGAGRLLATFTGLVSIWLTYAVVRRFVSRAVALIAALLLAVNLGHLFWSQSIRYYTTLLGFEILCVYGFLEGFEKGRYWALVGANLAFACALLTHFSALLLAPVLIGYLVLMVCRRESEGGYGLKGYLLFGLPFLAICGLFAGKIIQVQGIQANFITSISTRSSGTS